MKRLRLVLASLALTAVPIVAQPSPASAELYNCSLFPGNPSSYEGSSCASQAPPGGFYPLNQQRAAPICNRWTGDHWVTSQAFGNWVGRNITSYAYCPTGYTVSLWQLQRR